ncbi:MAG: response regulator transcription factor [Oscillospiraceae bacterium]|nr:response regulator transcription factor [Oscillospiraceae bacterium]
MICTRILIIEDEERMARTVQNLLVKHGYSADIAFDGEMGLDYVLTGSYDLVILDIMLPRLNGYQVLEAVRRHGLQTPVLMLSARSDVEDRIEGLDKGADYYLAKPFSSAELLACLRALLRRPKEISSSKLTYGDIVLDTDSGRLSKGDKSVMLNKKERDVLRLLMQKEGQPVSREALFSNVWGIDSGAESNVVEAYMSFLRKKLAFVQSNLRIASLRRIGYCLSMEETAS